MLASAAKRGDKLKVTVNYHGSKGWIDFREGRGWKDRRHRRQLAKSSSLLDPDSRSSVGEATVTFTVSAPSVTRLSPMESVIHAHRKRGDVALEI